MDFIDILCIVLAVIVSIFSPLGIIIMVGIKFLFDKLKSVFLEKKPVFIFVTSCVLFFTIAIIVVINDPPEDDVTNNINPTPNVALTQNVSSNNDSYNEFPTTTKPAPGISDLTNGNSSSSNNNYDKYPQSFGFSYYILNTETKKYHRTYCNYLPSKENSLKISRDKITYYKNKGYTPCGHCMP